METLFKKHDQYMANTPTEIIRDIMDEIHWDSRLIAIIGARGVGKSTLIRQFIKKNYPVYDRSVLYCSLDSVYFSTHTILDLVEDFSMNGGKRLFFDEVHKYMNWSREIKEIYDLYPDIKVVISGSSLLHILNADADLSRRCIKYTMSGLSFREFLRFYTGIEIKRTNIEDIIENPAPLCSEVNNLCKPVEQFKKYLAYGYYPFYIENSDNYYTRIEQVTNFVIETELPLLRRVDVTNVRKIKALVSIIASSIPFELDASKLSRAIGTGRDTVVEYLKHLEDARIFNLLYSDAHSVGKLTRPDKIYLENPNLLYALSSNEVSIGTARETFVVNHLKNRYTIEYGRKQGDFKVKDTYTFEVGGKDKAFSQIAGIQNSFVLSDDMETPLGRKLPIWLIGFVN